MEMIDWLHALASDAPTPGGGGVAAMTGAMASGLSAMAAALTVGKKKYECYRTDLERILSDSRAQSDTLYGLISKDADAFFPLSRAYGIPKDDPSRDEVLEEALRNAANAPMEMLSTLSALPALLEELTEKGSKLLVSDVGCGASLCASAAECALFNVLVNTKLMKDRAFADKMTADAMAAEQKIAASCREIAARVKEKLL